MGDFNYSDICWRLNSAKTARSNKFLTSLADNFILQKVEDATRGSAILDLILTNKENLVNEVREMGNLGWSDHVLLKFEILRKGEVKHSQTRILDIKRADVSKLRELLGAIPWSDVLKDMRANDGWEVLKNEILKAQNQTVPMKMRNGRRQKKQIDAQRTLK